MNEGPNPCSECGAEPNTLHKDSCDVLIERDEKANHMLAAFLTVKDEEELRQLKISLGPNW